LLLHGLPGVEKNTDVAYALRDEGWNCLLFHYRGSWGSEGNYSLFQLTDDVNAALNWTLRQSCVDGERLAIVGHSMGGYVSLATAAMNPRLQAIVAICPLIAPARAPLPLALFTEFASMLHGTTASELQAQYDRLPSIEASAPYLKDRPILMLTGALDDVFPHDHYPPLLEALPTIEWHEFPEGDHFMSLCRPMVTSLAIPWLVNHLGR
jgi:pimeloyl-ACP methyl ester carboxylesterase